MTAIETAIQDAGYHPSHIKSKERIFLDPAFWQALGKARGWNKLDEFHNCDEMGCSSIEHFTDDKWKMVWHRFIDHLAEGKDAESFFAFLTNK